MALSVTYMDVGKGLNYDGTTYNLYGAMFGPPYDITGTRSSFNVVDPISSVSLSGFQQGLEVCVCGVIVENTGSTTETADVVFGFQQYKNGSYVDGPTPYVYHQSIEGGYGWARRMWVGIDPDEVRPDYTSYRFYLDLNGTKTYKSFGTSGLSFDSTPHPAGYMWVEGSYLCYIPPCYYSGSSTTGYKHMISPDTGYSGSNVGTDKAGSIRIPSSSGDHHIYYVNEYGVVARTKESYTRDDTNVNVGSDKAGSIWLTPSTSSWPEQVGYNYLCYVDGGGYKRRMGVGEI